jgi:hypothetical protein
MEFHPYKCNVLAISKKANLIKFEYKLHGQTLKSVNNAKYLGCLITSDLLDLFPYLLQMYLAPLRWTISRVCMSFCAYRSHTVDAYSTIIGLTSELYAFCFVVPRLIPLSRFTRNMHNLSFLIPNSNSDYRKFSFFPHTIRDWNSLQPDIVCAGSHTTFKAKVAAMKD